MITVTIDGKTLDVAEGTTILDAARALDIEIPHLCFAPGLPPNTSCMLCVVEDTSTGRLVPSCATPVRPDLIVQTRNERLDRSRKAALELILREHVGDCEAPCQRVCPLHHFIPKMIRLVSRSAFQDATDLVFRELGLPGFLSTLCPAPCLKGCRRSQHDSGVSIPHLVQAVVDRNLMPTPELDRSQGANAPRVAIIGAGPTGLAAAMALLNRGIACTLFDRRSDIGGTLREGIPLDPAADSLWRRQMGVFHAWGGTFQAEFSLRDAAQLDTLRGEVDVLVLATGRHDISEFEALGVPVSKTGIKTDANGMTSIPNLLAAGEAVKTLRNLTQAVSAGQDIARSVCFQLDGHRPDRPADRFNSKMGRLKEGEMAVFLRHANPSDAILPAQPDASFAPTDQQVQDEARRCLHCDCRKPETCKLRQYADAFGAKAQRFKMDPRPSFSQENADGNVVFEPMKCIKCGICVRIMERDPSLPGLAFVDRGIDVRPAVPFDVPLDEALGTHADACVQACPTAALAFSKSDDAQPRPVIEKTQIATRQEDR